MDVVCFTNFKPYMYKIMLTSQSLTDQHMTTGQSDPCVRITNFICGSITTTMMAHIKHNIQYLIKYMYTCTHFSIPDHFNIHHLAFFLLHNNTKHFKSGSQFTLLKFEWHLCRYSHSVSSAQNCKSEQWGARVQGHTRSSVMIDTRHQVKPGTPFFKVNKRSVWRRGSNGWILALIVWTDYCYLATLWKLLNPPHPYLDSYGCCTLPETTISNSLQWYMQLDLPAGDLMRWMFFCTSSLSASLRSSLPFFNLGTFISHMMITLIHFYS